MSGRTGMLWDAVVGWPLIPADAAGQDAVEVALAACDHGALAGQQLRSTHRTSTGTVAYARCACGAWLVLLDGQLLAAAHPRPRTARPPGRGRLSLWSHGRVLWKWARRGRQ